MARSSFVFPGCALPFVLLLAACGESPPPATAHDAHERSDLAHGDAPNAPPKPVTELKRTAVRETIAAGLGAFLQNVTVEDWPVMHEGKFYGFKLRSINADWGVDLRPGDVVTKVNGVVPEHPDDADAALRSLDKAKSLKVEFERDGKARTLELPIVD